MLTKRIIACLDVNGGRVVKGVQFTDLRDAGDPAELAKAHSESGADEIVLLDISATHEEAATLFDTVRRTARQLFIPFTVGGGIRTLADAAAVFDAGADKISINSAALADPVSDYAALRNDLARKPWWWRSTQSARTGKLGGVHARRPYSDGRDAVEWAREAESRGAGEILLTSMDRDGTRSRFRLRVDAGGRRRRANSGDCLRRSRWSAPILWKYFGTGTPTRRWPPRFFITDSAVWWTLSRRIGSHGIPVRWPC